MHFLGKNIPQNQHKTRNQQQQQNVMNRHQQQFPQGPTQQQPQPLLWKQFHQQNLQQYPHQTPYLAQHYQFQPQYGQVQNQPDMMNVSPRGWMENSHLNGNQQGNLQLNLM